MDNQPLHLFFLQVYNETLQEKLVTIMKNLNITFLWIGGLYNNTTFYNYKMPLHAVIFLSAQVSHTEPGQVFKIYATTQDQVSAGFGPVLSDIH